MPELTDQMYCSEQISIPPTFPYLLRQYAKAAIRSQPIDLLQTLQELHDHTMQNIDPQRIEMNDKLEVLFVEKENVPGVSLHVSCTPTIEIAVRWSTAYFRCLSLNIPPPVKPRLEYPIPHDHYGITPGWLKALLYQLQNNQTISFKILWDRWTGACLSHNTLVEILCLGGFDNADAIPWLKFIGLCAAHLTNDLTNTMKLICEIMTEEPEGGSAMIPLETFTDLYRFLARIDASKPQKLKNTYFSDSLLYLSTEIAEKDEQPKEAKEESLIEEESLKSQAMEESESVESVKFYTKDEISCPSLVGDDDYSADYYIPEAEEEQAVMPSSTSHAFTGDPVDFFDMPSEGDYDDMVEMDEDEDKNDVISGDSETRITASTENERGEDMEEHVEGEIDKYNEDTNAEETGSAVDHPVEGYVSVDTIQEIPRKIVADDFEDEKTLLEDLQRLKALQQEIAGETDEEVEKYKCKLIEEMPLTESQQEAIKEFQDVEELKKPEEEEEEVDKPEESEKGEKEKKVDEEIYINVIPGIGPTVPDNLVEAVCEYMKSISVIQHGMVMPRNIRHYNCPPLELLEY